MGILRKKSKKRKKVKVFLKSLQRKKRRNYMKMMFNFVKEKKNE